MRTRAYFFGVWGGPLDLLHAVIVSQMLTSQAQIAYNKRRFNLSLPFGAIFYGTLRKPTEMLCTPQSKPGSSPQAPEEGQSRNSWLPPVCCWCACQTVPRGNPGPPRLTMAPAKAKVPAVISSIRWSKKSLKYLIPTAAVLNTIATLSQRPYLMLTFCPPSTVPPPRSLHVLHCS